MTPACLLAFAFVVAYVAAAWYVAGLIADAVVTELRPVIEETVRLLARLLSHTH